MLCLFQGLNSVLQERMKPSVLSLMEENHLQQENLIDRSVDQMDMIRTVLRQALNRHLNVHQSFRLDEYVPAKELHHRTLRLSNGSCVHFRSITTGAWNAREPVHVELQLDALAPSGDGQANTNYSRAVSLSIFCRDGRELSLAAISDETELIMTQDPQLSIPPSLYENVSTERAESFHWKSIHLDELRTDAHLSFSLDFQFYPLVGLSVSVGCAFVFQFDPSPQLDRPNGWRLVCPSTAGDMVLSTHIDNEQIADGDHHLLIFGIRRLTGEEVRERCSQPSSSSSAKGFTVKKEQARFSVDYRWRVFSSGGYYLNEQHRL